MASPDWQQKVLPPEYGADVSFGLFTTHVRVSDNGLGVGQALLWSHLGQDRCPRSLHLRPWEGCAGIAAWLGQSWVPDGRDPPACSRFIKQFLNVRGDFPLEFYATGCVPSTDKNWWGRMVGLALIGLEDLQLQAELYGAIRAVQYGILHSTNHFYAILERYNLETCTFDWCFILHHFISHCHAFYQ